MVFFQQPLLQVFYPMLPQVEVHFPQTGRLLTPCLLPAATTGRGALWTGLAATDFDLFHQEEFGQQNL